MQGVVRCVEWTWMVNVNMLPAPQLMFDMSPLENVMPDGRAPPEILETMTPEFGNAIASQSSTTFDLRELVSCLNSAIFDFSRAPERLTSTIEERMPMIATTMSSSISVNPFVCFFYMVFDFVCIPLHMRKYTTSGKKTHPA